jgi:hypothetical protein
MSFKEYYTSNKKIILILSSIFIVFCIVTSIIAATLIKKQSQSNSSAKNSLTAINSTLTPTPTAFDMEACKQSLRKPGEPEANIEAICTAQKTGEPIAKTTSESAGSKLFSIDPVVRGKYLSNDFCEGTGSKKLEVAPMASKDISTILPYGLMVGGHVTPVDHQYFFGKNQKAAPDTYNVYAPSDGNIVSFEYDDRRHENGVVKGNYRVVISYSCTFFSYFDLATSLAPDIQSQLPQNWEASRLLKTAKIPVKKGQVVAKVGAQSLDFAVWDTTKTDKGLLVPNAYSNMEPWKIHTVQPLDYFTDSAKDEVLSHYIRKTDPIDGIVGHDIDGKAVGNWFLEGTNGYIGFAKEPSSGMSDYYKGHLSISPDYIDPNGWVFSIGDLNGQPTQLGIKDPELKPNELGVENGMTKYSLYSLSYIDETGKIWVGGTVPKTLKHSLTLFKGTLLVQMVEGHKMKIEVVMGKTPQQVSAFTKDAKIFTRGDDATVMMKGN